MAYLVLTIKEWFSLTENKFFQLLPRKIEVEFSEPAQNQSTIFKFYTNRYKSISIDPNTYDP